MRTVQVPRRGLVVGALALFLVGGALVVARQAGPPEALEELEAAGEAGDDARSRTRAIIENLESIASNLEAGAELSEESASIHELTERQRASLGDLIAVLRSQLRTLGQTRSSLSETEESTAGVARLGRRQADVIRRSVAALRELQGYIADATRTSARFAIQARYGARLAEDSRKHFRP